MAERKKGEAWVLADVERGAEAVKGVTGTKPVWLRPPDWDLADDARQDLEKHGFRILTISSQNPVALRDVNSLDYLCAGKGAGCPKPSLAQGVIKAIEQREKHGVYHARAGLPRTDDHHRTTAGVDLGAEGERVSVCDGERVYEAGEELESGDGTKSVHLFLQLVQQIHRFARTQ